MSAENCWEFSAEHTSTGTFMDFNCVYAMSYRKVHVDECWEWQSSVNEKSVEYGLYDAKSVWSCVYEIQI